MSKGLVDAVKRAALEAMETHKPCDLRWGKVISVDPLQVQISQQLILPESVLIIPEYLTEHEIEVTVKPEYGWNTKTTEGGTDLSLFESHKHDISFNRKKLLIHGELKVDDKVVLIRQQGGQHFLILDRIRGD